MYNEKWLQDLREEERRLEERLAYVREQIRGMEYQKPREGYAINSDFDFSRIRVIFGDGNEE